MNTIIVGRALSALAILFLAFDTGVKLVEAPVVAETLGSLGYRADLGLFVWGGLYLRSERLRELIPAMRRA
ncbi:MAG TPA: hypothetical protein VFL30_01225 [Rhodanobacteraceae bacterium]|nr:hypothetical protein [Rhodanobacteraceae bacterium]